MDMEMCDGCGDFTNHLIEVFVDSVKSACYLCQDCYDKTPEQQNPDDL